MPKEKCLCPAKCDCQNPPPENWDGKKGIYLTSNKCPVHNFYPYSNPECPVHGNMEPLEFDHAKCIEEKEEAMLGLQLAFPW